MIADFIDPSNEIPRGSNVVASTANRFLKFGHCGSMLVNRGAMLRNCRLR